MKKQTKREKELVALLKSARLMLYAWKGVQRKMGWGSHTVLEDLIRDIEKALKDE